MDIFFFNLVLTILFACNARGSQHRKRHHHRYHDHSYLRQGKEHYINGNTYGTGWKEEDPPFQGAFDGLAETNSTELQSDGSNQHSINPKDFQLNPNDLSASSITSPQGKIPLDDKQLANSRWTLKFHGMAKEHAKNNTCINITAQVGGNAFLPCKVGHLGDRQISWIRNWRVLASGKMLYTHDPRLTVLHEPGSQDWVLHIKWATLKDAGNYECQVSTGTGVISMFVNLKVVIPEAFIPGQGQFIVERGSPIALTCVIKNSPSIPKYVLWHHNGDLLNFLRDRQEVLLSMEVRSSDAKKGFKTTLEDEFEQTSLAENDTIISRLRVDEAEEYHSGNYSCSAPNTKPASTIVFITEGDKTAAVQRIDSGCEKLRFQVFALWTFLIILSAFR